MLLDGGASLSIISENIVREMNLSVVPENLHVRAFGGCTYAR
jgi:hypothetical protein